MTYTNTGFSAHPLANPFNCRQIGNYSLVGFGYGRKSSAFRSDLHAKLPEPKALAPGEIESQGSLEVPNQLGPELGVSRIDTIGMAQRFPGLVTCPDGTVIDFKTRKVVADPNRPSSNGEWAPLKVISPPQTLQSWNDASAQSPQPEATQSLSDTESQKYWQAQADAEKARQGEMSDAQRELLADLEAGKLMKLSRLELVDESLKDKAADASKSV